MNREHRGRQFWLKVFNHLKTREVADILIAVTDDLKGIGEALATVFPAIALQTCIAHLTRSNLDLASREGRKLLATASEPIHTVPSAGATAVELDPLQARALELQISDRGDNLAPILGSNSFVVRVYATHSPSNLHDQRHREHQRAVAQDHQDQRLLPQRRRSRKADLAGTARYRS